MGAMAQADVGYGVNAASPEGKLIKGHEIHCMATTASGTFGAPLRNKAEPPVLVVHNITLRYDPAPADLDIQERHQPGTVTIVLKESNDPLPQLGQPRCALRPRVGST